MTPLPKLIDASGKPFPLERQLASGGEGAVFTMPNDKSQVAKVYHKSLTSDEIEKLTVIVGLVKPKLLGVAAWPNGLLFNAYTRQVIGFVMPRLIDYQEIWRLYHPIERLKYFPHAEWKFQVRAAQNLAAAFDEIHTTGCVVGDVQLRNAHVSQKALVRLVDCDSFQVRANGKQYLCKVGLPHYIPPELQGKQLSVLVRTENHDRFGMAVLIYQLLFVGKHPYMGLYRGADDPSFEQLITDFRFAQGPACRTWGMDPPPHTPTFADIPPNVGKLFRQAFERGSETGTRPRPSEWLTALKQLESEIVECAVDPGHKYWRGANSCVWCRIAAVRGGPEYYYTATSKGTAFIVDEAKLQEVLRRLAATQAVDFPYTRVRFAPAIRPAGRALVAEFAVLMNNWRIAKESQGEAIHARNIEELQEIQLIEESGHQLIKKYEAEFLVLDTELETEYEAESVAARIARREVHSIQLVLLVAIMIGFFILPIGLFHWAFAIVGFMTILIFGVSYIVYVLLSPYGTINRRMAAIRKKRSKLLSRIQNSIRIAKKNIKSTTNMAKESTLKLSRRHEQLIDDAETMYRRRVAEEVTLRQRRYNDAEGKLLAVEQAWTEKVKIYRRQHQTNASDATSKILECRSLAAQYQVELQLLTAKAESAARLRHLRLHSIADANISKIGVGRKQSLAARNINTAADIDEQVIRGIDGFGDALTRSLLAWRQVILQQFRFDPHAAMSPAELRPLKSRFQTRQQQIINELDQRLTKLESLAPACNAEIQLLFPKLTAAVAEYEQTKADLELMTLKN